MATKKKKESPEDIVKVMVPMKRSERDEFLRRKEVHMLSMGKTVRHYCLLGLHVEDLKRGRKRFLDVPIGAEAIAEMPF